MADLRELLDEIRTQPGLFIGKRSAIRLNLFLLGWLHGAGLENDQGLMLQFQEWLASRLKVNPKFSWSEVLTLYSLDEVAAYEKFFSFWDEFLSSQVDSRE